MQLIAKEDLNGQSEDDMVCKKARSPLYLSPSFLYFACLNGMYIEGNLFLLSLTGRYHQVH